MSDASRGSAGRFCYVVMEHAEPERVLRLAEAVGRTSPSALLACLYNGPLPTWEAERLVSAGVVRVGSGRAAEWGAWSLVERLLEGFRDALEHEWDWLVLVSGQDYPKAHLGRWERETRERGVDGLVNARQVGPQDTELVERYTFHWRRVPGAGRPGQFRHRAVVHLLWRLSLRTSVMTTRHDGPAVWVGVRNPRMSHEGVWKGDLWTALSRRAVETLLEKHRSGATDRFRQALLADEAFVPTLLHAAGLRLASEQVSVTRWVADDPGHPRSLAPEDLEGLLRSSAPFARKVSGASGRELAELLDAAVANAARDCGEADPRGTRACPT